MNARERLLTAMRGGEVDRVPLVLEGFHAARMEDVKDPGKRPVLERVFEHLVFFRTLHSGDNRYLMTPPQRMSEVGREDRGGDVTITTKIDTPKGPLTAIKSHNALSQTPWTVKYPVESLADIERIRSVPWELPPRLGEPDMSLGARHRLHAPGRGPLPPSLPRERALDDRDGD